MEQLEPRDVPALFLSVATATLSEAGAQASALATLTRDGSPTDPLTVNLTSSDTSETAVPYSVTIPANQASVTFNVTAVDDTLTDGTQPAAVRAIVAPAITQTAGGTLGEVVRDVAVQADGKIVSVGYRAVTGAGANTGDFVVSRHLADGTLDTAFGTGGRVQTDVAGGDDQAMAVAVQPDGKIVVAGHALPGSGYGFAVARYNPNGNLDTTFGTGGKVLLTNDQYDRFLYDLVIQPDGKILLAGDTATRAMVVRLTSSGALDTGFGNNGTALATVGGPQAVLGLAVAPDGAVLAAIESGAGIGVAKFTAAGVPDASFGVGGVATADVPGQNDGGRDLAVLPDGKIVVLGQTWRTDFNAFESALVRFTAAGTLDTTFGTSGVSQTYLGGSDTSLMRWNLDALADGRLVVAAQTGKIGVTLYAPDGTFLASNYTAATAIQFAGSALAPDGTLVVAGRDSSTPAVGLFSRFAIPTTLYAATSVSVVDNERPLYVTVTPAAVSEAAGATAATATVTRSGDWTSALTVTLASSDPSATVPASVVIPAGQASAMFPVAAVNDALANGTRYPRLTATASVVTAAGGVDPSYTGGSVGILWSGRPNLTVAPDGSVYAVGTTGGSSSTVAVAKLDGFGGPDPYFGFSGVASIVVGTSAAPNDIVLQPDGKIILVGSADGGSVSGVDLIVARLLPTGAVDTTFGTNGVFRFETSGRTLSGTAVRLLSDGRILVGGTSATSDFAVVRLTAAGAIDTTFGVNGWATAPAAGTGLALAVGADGRIVQAGSTGNDVMVARYTAAGAVDTTFDGDGVATVPVASFGPWTSAKANGVVVLADGRVVVGGGAGTTVYPTDGDMFAVRFTAAGALDTSFSGDGLVTADFQGVQDSASRVLLQADGKVLLTGTAGQSGGYAKVAAVRLTTAGGLDPTFDGDGKAEAPWPPNSTSNYFGLGAAFGPDGRLNVLYGTVSMAVKRFDLGQSVAATAFADLTVLDDEPSPAPTGLTLAVAPISFGEGGGATAATGTVTRSGATAGPLTVILSSNDTTEATVPATVNIPAGQASATFPVAAVDDVLLDGSQTVTFGASVTGAGLPVGPDATFGTSGMLSVPSAMIRSESSPAVTVQADGKVLVAGMGASSNGSWVITRLTAAGFPDNTFGTNGSVTLLLGSGTEAWPNDLVVQPDGKIVIVGYATGGTVSSYGDMTIVRLTATGGLDSGFGVSGVRRLEVTYSNSSTGVQVRLQPDGKILVSGHYGTQTGVVARLTTTGALDSTFGGGAGWTLKPAIADGPYGTFAGTALTVAGDGSFLVAGSGPNGLTFIKYTAGGLIDTTFSGDGVAFVAPVSFGPWYSMGLSSLAYTADGRIVAVGTATDGYSPELTDIIATRLTADGQPDPTFNGTGRLLIDFNGGRDTATKVIPQADGKMLIAGSSSVNDNRHDFSRQAAFVRLSADGTFDPSFDGDGKYSLPWPGGAPTEFAQDAALDGSGRIVAVVNSGTALRAVRLNATQAQTLLATATATVLDNEPTLTVSVAPSTFSEGSAATPATGTVTRAGGDLSQPLTVVLRSTDTTEATVPATVTIPAGQASVTFPVTAVDDLILDGSQSVTIRAATTPGFQLQANGVLGEIIYDVAVQPDGKVVSVGIRPVTGGGNNTFDAVVSRHLPDGTLDTTFGIGGRVQTDIGGGIDWAEKVLIQADGKIVVGGTWATTGGAYGFAALRYTAAGVLDTTFGTNGKTLLTAAGGVGNNLYAMALQIDGKLLLAGGYGNQAAVARLTAAGAVDTAFGTNGVATTTFGQTTAVAAYAVAVNVDYGIFLAGGTDGGGYNSVFALARFTPTGVLDNPYGAFGTNGIVTTDLPGRYDTVRGMVVQNNGRIVVVGLTRRDSDLTTADVAVVRYNSIGALDASFGAGGVTLPSYGGGPYSNNTADVELMADGRLLVGALGATKAGVILVSSDGMVLQSDFTSGNSPVFRGLALGPNGTVVVAGRNGTVNPAGTVSRFAIPDTAFATTTVTVTDDEQNLTISASPLTFSETAGATASTLTLTRSGGNMAAAYTVTLGSTTPSRVTVPASVTFPANQATVTVPVTAVDNAVADGTEGVVLSASGPNGQNGVIVATVVVTVVDDEPPAPPPTLTMSLTGPLLEHAGANAGTGTLTRSGGYPNLTLTVNLTSNDTTELTVPVSVTFPANQTTVTFPLNAVDDFLLDGDQTVTVSATLVGAGTEITGAFTYRNYAGPVNLIGNVAVQADGKVLATGRTAGGDFITYRYIPLSSGAFTTDTTWGTSGFVVTDVSGGTDTPEAVYAYPDGRVLVAGTGPYSGTTDIVLARYTSTGALDTTFDGDGKLTLDLGTGFYNEGWDVTVAADGHILLGVAVDRDAPTYVDFGAIRLNADGSRDTTFGTNGLAAAVDFAGLSDRPFAVAVQPDGKVLLAGEPSGGNASSTFAVVRYTTAGVLDTTFGTGGKASIDLTGSYEGATDLLLRPDGRIVLAGRVGKVGSSPTAYDPALVQLTAAGALDTTFGVNGVRIQSDTNGTDQYGPVRAALQADGRVVVAGTVGSPLSAAYTRLLRFSTAGTLENAQVGPYTQSVTQGLGINGVGDVFVAYAYGAGGSGYVDRYTTTPTTPAAASATVVVRDNEPFAAVADSYTTPVNTQLVVNASGVLANDTITRPISPTAELVSQPAQGTVALAANGSFTYTPPAGFFGTVSFTYQVRDGVAVSNTVAVSIRVNNRPLAVADSYSADEDTPLVVGLDVPPSSALPIRFGFDESATGTAAAVNGGSLATTGQFVGAATRTGSPAYTVGPSIGSVNLSGGANGYITAGDQDALDALTGITVAGWVRLTALPTNGDVIAEDWRPTSPFPPAGSRGWSFFYDSVTANTVDVRFQANESSGGTLSGQSYGLTLNTGTVLNQWVFLAFNYDPTDNGPYGPSYRAMSVFAGTLGTPVYLGAKSYFSNFLGGPNDAPLTVGGSPYPGFGGSTERTPPAWFDEFRVYDRPLSLAELEAVRRGTGAQVGLLGNDSDADNDPLAVQTVTQPANGTVTWNANGSFTYTPAPDFNGTDTFTYTITDGLAQSAPATVTITVRPRPDVVGGPLVNNGVGAQRSRVSGVTMVFDTALDTALVSQAGAFTVRRVSDGATVGTVTATPTVVGGQTRVALTFAGANTESGSLADGRWVVVVNRNFVRTPAGVQMAADHTSANFHRLFGDINGDTAVDFDDLNAFGGAFGTTSSNAAYRVEFDFNADGAVDFDDLNAFGGRFGTSI